MIDDYAAQQTPLLLGCFVMASSFIDPKTTPPLIADGLLVVDSIITHPYTAALISYQDAVNR
ncbi:hypothetical protein CUC53_01945 [Aeromonas cavernicola]|uniref:Uncharacterized protein n=1 Tax=Aeromonas cavernicola TaxID=1006623 RepID=A0A2H9U8V3_9GAMM|nr:hypothetical protein CUC53_01945 [Aeromonas cavernicola]